ncbi:hypothetical protein ACFV5N_00915 [Streptomyces sp. NPDC059853]|uniref:hypothetical protein n=1 Tax=Streptomyces sp. NPDC059853 TaxID=3346973 RepID=UPI003647B116
MSDTQTQPEDLAPEQVAAKGKQYAFDWDFNGGFAVGRLRAADLEEAVELALEAGELKRGPGDFADPEAALYLDGYLKVQGASEPHANGWATVYEPEVIQAHCR